MHSYGSRAPRRSEAIGWSGLTAIHVGQCCGATPGLRHSSDRWACRLNGSPKPKAVRGPGDRETLSSATLDGVCRFMSCARKGANSLASFRRSQVWQRSGICASAPTGGVPGGAGKSTPLATLKICSSPEAQHGVEMSAGLLTVALRTPGRRTSLDLRLLETKWCGAAGVVRVPTNRSARAFVPFEGEESL